MGLNRVLIEPEGLLSLSSLSLLSSSSPLVRHRSPNTRTASKNKHGFDFYATEVTFPKKESGINKELKKSSMQGSVLSHAVQVRMFSHAAEVGDAVTVATLSFINYQEETSGATPLYLAAANSSLRLAVTSMFRRRMGS